MSKTKSSETITKNIQMLKKELHLLLSASKFMVFDVKKNRNQHDTKGVYLISINEETVYVGKTKTGTISSRIKAHLTITRPSTLNQMIKRHQEYPQELDKYEVQYIEVNDVRKRILVENFAIAVLNPPFNRD